MTILYICHRCPFPPKRGGKTRTFNKMLAAEMRRATSFDPCTATTHADWETLESYRTGVAADLFPKGVGADFCCPSAEAYDAHTPSFIGRMDYCRKQECMPRFCPDLAGAQVASAVAQAADRRRRFLTQNTQARRVGRGHGHRIGAGRAALRAPVDIDGGIDADSVTHFLVADTPQEYSKAILRIVDDPAERQHMLSNQSCPAALDGETRLDHRSHHQEFLGKERKTRVNISVFGLGYVGSVSLACLRRDGQKVSGVDIGATQLDLVELPKRSAIVASIDGLCCLVARCISAARPLPQHWRKFRRAFSPRRGSE